MTSLTSRRTVATVLAAAAIVVPIGACGSSTVTTTKDKPDHAKTTGVKIPAVTPADRRLQAKAKAEAAAAYRAEQTLGVGDSTTLQGSDDGERIKVKVVALTDPLQTDEYDQPSSGKRFVGVQLRLVNVGTVTYNDSPSNGATLLLGNDEQADSTILTDLPSGDGLLDGSATIAPGDSRVGYIPYEVADGAKLKGFQFTLDSGFADQTGQWKL